MKNYYAPVAGARLDLIVRELPFYHGNILKYIWRAPYKGGVQDLLKAVWYVKALNTGKGPSGYSLSEIAKEELICLREAKIDVAAASDVEVSRMRALRVFADMVLGKEFSQQNTEGLRIRILDMMVDMQEEEG